MKDNGYAARYFEPRMYLTCLLGTILILGTAVPGASADEKDRCEGTKKQRRQKMELRQIGDEQFAAMLDEYRRETRTDRQRIADTVLRRLERKYKNHLDTGSPFIYDILVLSGGGAKGAFGAGFLRGWGSLPPGPSARPEFDMVTGVSTGALISRAGIKAALGYNPMSAQDWKGERPSTRMGAMGLLRGQLENVRQKMETLSRAKGKKKEEIHFSATQSVFKDILEGKEPSPTNIVMEPVLVVRQSTSAPPRAEDGARRRRDRHGLR